MAKSKSILEKLEAEVVKDAGEYMKGQIKTKALHIGEISILALTGFFLISLGLSSLIAYYFPVLDKGFNFLILGIAFILISMSLKI